MQNKNPKSLFGVDLNEFSQNVNFAILATTIDFLYLRSSGSATGQFRVDKKFVEFAKGAKNFGIPVGAYHFAVPSTNLATADSQCDDFIGVLQQGFGTNNYGDLFPVLDVEVPVPKSISTETLLNWINRFRKRFESKTRRRLMLYTGAFFIDLYDNFFIPGKGFILSNMPLWIAMYTSVPGNPPYPKDAGGWTRWRIWQYSENGKINGVSSPVDLNWGPDSIDFLQQPRVVSNLNAVGNSSNVFVTWSPNTDVDLSGYNLFANSDYIATVNRKTSSYTIPRNKIRMIPNQPIEISIEAFDFDGEFSPRRAKTLVKMPREFRGEKNSGIYINSDGIIINIK